MEKVIVSFSTSTDTRGQTIVWHHDERGNIREIGLVRDGEAYLTHIGHSMWVGDSVKDVKAAAWGECDLR